VDDAQPLVAIDDKGELITAFGITGWLAIDDVHKQKW
jgi:hypothetical protein